MRDSIKDPPTFPRGVMDPLCPSEHVISESTDRRILWHLESQLAVSATTNYLRDMQWNLKRYLVQTCAHHWHSWEDDEVYGAGRQCLWCHSTEMQP
jgi:hypothetical protein